jgi:hypothetical protein
MKPSTFHTIAVVKSLLCLAVAISPCWAHLKVPQLHLGQPAQRKTGALLGPVSHSTPYVDTVKLIVSEPYGGNHYGGSCQIGFSIDQGATFRTAVSYPGNCPHRTGTTDPSGQTFPFTVPTDLPEGETIFAWTWMNREQEFFMNCAVVDITAPAQATKHKLKARTEPMLDIAARSRRVPGKKGQRLVQEESTLPFNERPVMLFADVNNGCFSPLTTAELQYPNPGPDVVEGDGEYPLELPTGDCA